MKKKILKIIQIVYDILSLCFIVFVCVAIGITPNKGNSNSQSNEVVEVKKRDNLVINYGWGLASPFEVFTRNELYESLGSSFTTAHITGTRFSMPYITSDTYYISWSQLDMYNPETSVNNNGIALTSAYFDLFATGSSGYNRYQTWYLTLNFGSSGAIQYQVDIVYDNSSNSGILGAVLLLVRSTDLGSSYYLAFNSNSYLYNIFYNNEYQRGYAAGYDTGYDEGYDTGYEEGKERQKEIDRDPASETYEYIFGLGYDEGLVDGMRGTESNAFVVIGQAFGAVGSILSIEVMPNLPLWVLVFTPLIIVVVIVVVKLIKG